MALPPVANVATADCAITSPMLFASTPKNMVALAPLIATPVLSINYGGWRVEFIMHTWDAQMTDDG